MFNDAGVPFISKRGEKKKKKKKKNLKIFFFFFIKNKKPTTNKKYPSLCRMMQNTKPPCMPGYPATPSREKKTISIKFKRYMLTPNFL